MRIVGGNNADAGEWPWQIGLWHVPRKGKRNPRLINGRFEKQMAVVSDRHKYD